MRDAHQSLLATRVRTYDLLAIAAGLRARLGAGLFSLEMLGRRHLRRRHALPQGRSLGAARRRCATRSPTSCFQMLLRGSNAVGYTNYPDNVVQEFVDAGGAERHRHLPRLRLASTGRENMRVAMDAVREENKVCEAAICYTGDILDPKRDQVPL